MTESATKVCASCGRVMEWRAKWAENWESVRYCSDRCRRRKVTDEDRLLEREILELLDQRAAGATICPSEAARALGGEWQDRMEATRAAARRLVAAGRVEITQGGRVVDPSTAKGPIRIRRVRGAT
ncbi:MAG: DUF3253 domain-containing protein [Ilumatobacteraceae bacterium]